MPLFVIPGALRDLAEDRAEIDIEGRASSLSAALDLLWNECPALRDRVMNERGAVRPHVNIFVDGENYRFLGGLDAPVRETSEIVLVPAISGGST